MIRAREGIFKNYDFCNWTTLEMIQSLWMEASESKNNINYKYYWWGFNLKKKKMKKDGQIIYLILNFLKLT